ncbi:Detected protein of unknown function [Hibiscus syriacus]|uniref:BRI1 kinase inhibitor 1-like n=1 Tax=Hibiscus syriacus TaxID=106335 RepID=A0A6A3AJ82_HIBSY|nr:BRI1 kinase inhibitor 1-like [Hibiscus syriacus]KAE8704166.1 Detected protein of unknown function [Hibiscus syriacus]
MDTYHHQYEGGGGGGGKLKEETEKGSSSSTTPSHEFSFTLSLHSSSDHKSITVDLSPADDIFFHGHLLPLHLLTHPTVSPRLSTSSSDGFNVPGRDLFDDLKSVKQTIGKSDGNMQKHEAKVKNKSKSFTLFGLKRQQKGGGVNIKETEEKENHKKKMRFDVLRRYTRLIRPLLFFRRKRKACSFSGTFWNKKAELRGRRGGDYYSAPPSMRTSPSNSGLLVATSDGTMEELQAGIQSAIAHCNNSIKGEDKL